MITDHTKGKITQFTELTLFVDGGCEPRNPGGWATSGWVFYAAKEKVAEGYAVVQKGGELATNNVAEYSGLLLGLKFLAEQKWCGILSVNADSNLLVQQVNGVWKCKAPHLVKLRDEIWQLLDELKLQRFGQKSTFRLKHIRREQNTYADNLCHEAYIHEQKRDEGVAG